MESAPRIYQKSSTTVSATASQLRLSDASRIESPQYHVSSLQCSRRAMLSGRSLRKPNNLALRAIRINLGSTGLQNKTQNLVFMLQLKTTLRIGQLPEL